MDLKKKFPITVLGAGSWGTALALLLARNGNTTRLWSNEAAQIQSMTESRYNQLYFPAILLPENIEFYDNLEFAISGASDILMAVPSHAFRSVIQQIKPFLNSSHRIISATKGLDPNTCELMHQVVQDELGKNFSFAVLSGPTFAKEVAEGLPSAITLASENIKLAEELVERFHNQTFRVYTSSDVVGVQIGGAVKNVLAIAAGISDGLGYGANARCALITRGLAEITRLGVALGGQPETFMGLSGVGDLVLTSTDNQSRNRRFGLALGQGISASEAMKQINQVVEGAQNARQVYELSKQHHVSMPITEKVYGVIHAGLAPTEAVQALLMRSPKPE